MAGFALLLYKNTLFLDSLDALQEERAGRAARVHEECDHKCNLRPCGSPAAGLRSHPASSCLDAL